MILSRVTLATTLAAAMERLSESPRITAVCGEGKLGTGSPSIKTCSGGEGRRLTASRIARWVARRIFSVSIVVTFWTETAQRTWAALVISAKSSAPERGGQLLRVIEPGKPPVLEKNNRRSHDRACEWSAARFINAGDEKNAPLLESALVPE